MSAPRSSVTDTYAKLRRALAQIFYSSERFWARVTHRRDWLLRRMFNRWARWGAGEQMENDHALLTEMVFERMNACPGDRILELACGSGWASRRMARRAGESARVVGLDLADEMVHRAQAESGDFPNVSFVQGSAERLPFERDSFTKVLSVESFYFFDPQEKVLEELLRVMADRGELFLLLCLYKDNPESLRCVGELNMPVHIRSADEYKVMLQKVGWQDVQTEIFEPPRPAGAKPGPHSRALLITARKLDSPTRLFFTDNLASANR